MGDLSIEKIAKLARIDLNEAEIKMFSKDLEEVKIMFDEIDKIEIKDEPCFQPVEVKNMMRGDKVEEGFSLEEAFSNTEHKEDNFFKGPKV
ncbi:MAG: Asp-tRNA(Asn)/Glu-tRNA(Gln) amidotransferase GatCAB subunit C [Candidatus Aenigmatarchaeota archaeon]|nr:MAG: Asp-tRNA(Asn)/Glu-tRNA(Gln) amidotransferase GatCAB subunit C [Candidatus Aenigmarchaeota archaeon]